VVDVRGKPLVVVALIGKNKKTGEGREEEKKRASGK
jgi:hypothetical protein